ncbi:twin-arginine translocation signal domain-containing protein [Streptomyces sp. NPDC002677]|uniref:twin-arginine translocation signal domain-containing protein n=1 Tax=Streptomyces sp. NPDC002677 TaxID=3154774 RepID=UPI003316BEEA
MSSISRRSLLGYSGTAAAGAVVGTTASAQQTQAAESATETASTQFPEGTLFSGGSNLGGDADLYLTVKFSVDTNATDASGNRIDPVELAGLLSDFAVSRGWPAIAFYGTPRPAKLN